MSGRRSILLLPLLAWVLFGWQYNAVQAQSGWFHCDIQDFTYTGPGTRYFCRPVPDDFLCGFPDTPDFCDNRRDHGDNDDNDKDSSRLSGRESGSGSRMNVRRLIGWEIGVQWIIDAGIIAAVDVWGEDVRGEVCLDGVGSLLFIDTGILPRAQSWLDSVQRDGQTCAMLDRPGIVVLLPAPAQHRDCRVTTTGHLKMRAGPSLDEAIIGYLRRGITLRPLSRNKYWFNVEHQGQAGWIGAYYLSLSGDCGALGQVPDGETVLPDTPQSQQCRITTTGHLKMRAGPSLDEAIIGYLRRGITLRPLSRNKYWFNVEHQGQAGWIGAYYLSLSGDCD